MTEEAKKKHTLTVKPAILPIDRHAIEATLTRLGYKVAGGGTDTDLSSCDISFDGKS